jgi:hypothetical protein
MVQPEMRITDNRNLIAHRLEESWSSRNRKRNGVLPIFVKSVYSFAQRWFAQFNGLNKGSLSSNIGGRWRTCCHFGCH